MSLSLFTSRSAAQDLPYPLEVRIETSKDPLPVNLRPNASTSVALTLVNPGVEDLGGVTVKLVDPSDDRVIGQTAEVGKLAARGKVRVTFPKSKAPAEKKGKEEPAKMDSPGLAGPPFKLQLWIEAKQPKEFITVKRDVNLIIREPRDYVTASAEYDKERRRVGLKVRFANGDSLAGSRKCPLQMVLGPEFVASKNGTFTQVLTGLNQTVELFADDVAFADATIRSGRVYLNVDGYERAFTYPAALAGSGNLDELPLGQKIGARIRVPRYGKPSEKFPVHLEMDGPLSADYRIEVGLDRAGAKKQFDVQKFTGLRQQQVAINVASTGDFVCQTEVRDWQTHFDTTGVFGSLWFRVAVYRKDELVTLLIPEETRPNIAAQEAGEDFKTPQLFARVIQDETPPDGVEFVNPPKNWFTEKPLPLVLQIKKREEHQAPIGKKIVFIKGKAPPDGKAPPEAILAVGDYDPIKSTCSVTLPGLDKDEPLVISALVMTGAGVPGSKTITVNVLDRKLALATIKGKVSHGDSGQPNLPVVLGDPAGKAKAAAKTNAKGEFVFEKVPPGSYLIYSQRNFPALVGSAKVEVPVGAELIENVKIRLLAK